MKIEKLNDNQIRCTLNKHDLIDRELKLSELAYGSEKARGLFRDMMNQAFDEFGFEFCFDKQKSDIGGFRYSQASVEKTFFYYDE